VKRAFERAINLLYRYRMRAALAECQLGDDSRVSMWRVKALGGNVLRVGFGSLLSSKIVFERPGAALLVGDRTFVANGIMSVAARVEIGDDVLVSWGVSIVDHNSHSLRFSQRCHDVQTWREAKKNWQDVETTPVVICDKAWVGFNSIVLKGVTIGEGAIVGAGSVVTKDVAPWTVVAGNPARTIREIPPNAR
jgi:acetyltransferase-like isoleucine patch superfamily enzyme